jgi:hypothetical protein
MGRELDSSGLSVRLASELAATTAALAALLGCTRAGAASPDDRPWGVGVEFEPVGTPKGHLGIPVSGGEGGYHLPLEIVARRQLNAFSALNLGIGLPHSAMGVGGWLGYEAFVRLASNAGRTVAFDLYMDPGAQLGFAGPDYFARHGNDWVGFGYAAGGPLAFALRFPVGVRLRWAGGFVDSYVESVPIVALTPAIDPLFDLVMGTRFRF